MGRLRSVGLHMLSEGLCQAWRKWRDVVADVHWCATQLEMVLSEMGGFTCVRGGWVDLWKGCCQCGEVQREQGRRSDLFCMSVIWRVWGCYRDGHMLLDKCVVHWCEREVAGAWHEWHERMVDWCLMRKVLLGMCKRMVRVCLLCWREGFVERRAVARIAEETPISRHGVCPTSDSSMHGAALLSWCSSSCRVAISV